MQGRGKEILLLVLAVGALGVALYTFRGKPKPAPPPPAPTQPAKQQVAEAPGEDVAAEQGSGEAAAGPAVDPFSVPSGGPTAEPTEGTEPSGPELIGPPPEEPLPGAQPPSETGLKLEGIVAGMPTVAVIRHGDTPYFVTVGQQVAEGYRVEAIRGEGEVVLAGQHGRIVLRTGKSS